MTALRNRNVLITGASSGIGRALALALARRGNRVMIAARSGAELEALAASMPGHLLPLIWDVSDAAHNLRVRSEVQARLGRLDVLVLGAGTCEYIDNADIDSALVARVMAVNFFGAVNALEALLPLLRASARSNDADHRPYIVGISSMSTYVPLPRAEAYGASKAALRYLLESLRVDLARERIDVSVASPGFVRTPMTARNNFPMPFMLDAEAAVQHLLEGMRRRRLHIEFPRRMGWSLRVLAMLPEGWALALLRKLAR